MKHFAWISRDGFGAAAVALSLLACSTGSGEGPGSDGGRPGSTGADATARCTTDADCAASVPATTPAGCAVGKCDPVQGLCAYLARDQDGDGHASTTCRSTGGVAIQVGDDCDDQDPNLYPGRTETCSTTEDGGTPVGTVCVAGHRTCLPDGTASRCTGTIACASGCVAGMCTQCTPGQTQCSPGGVQMCTSSGAWGDPVSCGAGASCVGSAGSVRCAGSCAAGSTICSATNGVQTCSTEGVWSDPRGCLNQTCSSGSCQGTCAPGQTACTGGGNSLVTCGTGGTWSTPVPCIGQTCAGTAPGDDAGSDSTTATAASCQGECAPSDLHCNGAQPQSCDPTGQWQDTGAVCSGVTPECFEGACFACVPGDYRCSGTQPQQCNALGTAWRSIGEACLGASPVCLGGTCVTCAPGLLGCNGQQPQMCDTTGNWQPAGSTCSGQACVSGACTGVCTPGVTRCASNTQVETCGTDGQWGPATSCANACLGATGVIGGSCGGTCVPGASCGLHCSHGVATAASTCDTAGSCPGGGATSSCAPYACGGATCRTSCEDDSDCAAGRFCWLSACVEVASVAAGSDFTCALTTAGSVQCWGANAYGDLGNGSIVESLVPVAVQGLSSGVTAIVAGYQHACALTTAGGVLCWGSNNNGQLGNPTAGYAYVPVAVTGLSSGITAISAGWYHTCAVTTAGGVVCWGYNNYGQLGDSTTAQRDSPVAVTGLSSGVAAVAGGGSHTCALTTDGGLLCWGYNGYDQLGISGSTYESPVPVALPSLSSGVSGVSAGELHTCAVTTAGGVLCWGYNGYGALGSTGSSYSYVPLAVTGLSSGVTAVSAGEYHTCALTTAGGVTCWGYNGYGQLGNASDATSSNVPVASIGSMSSGIAAIAAGVDHTCALTSAGGVVCVGSNAYGQVGNGSTSTSQQFPTAVIEP